MIQPLHKPPFELRGRETEARSPDGGHDGPPLGIHGRWSESRKVGRGTLDMMISNAQFAAVALFRLRTVN